MKDGLIICPRCGSTNIRTRDEAGSIAYVCQECPVVWHEPCKKNCHSFSCDNRYRS